MCLAVPGKIVAIEGDIATVDYGEERRDAALVGQDLKLGDYVIVQGKIIIQHVPEEEAQQFYDLIQNGA